MDRGLTVQRVALGRDVRAVSEGGEDVELEGRMRLRPGRQVDVVIAPSLTGSETTRRAMVCSWRVVRLGQDGPLFRGLCRWL